MKISPEERQGKVVSRARELARAYLRNSQPFVWNATNISRRIRAACIALFAAYGARVRIVHVEAPAEKLYERNRRRAQSVPQSVINRLMERWEAPDLSEAHKVDWVLMD